MTAKQMILQTDVDYTDGEVESLMKRYAKQEIGLIINYFENKKNIPNFQATGYEKYLLIRLKKQTE